MAEFALVHEAWQNRDITTANRTQRRYNHRLKELVQTTKNIDIAVESSVPRSTAYGLWKHSNTEVVSLEVHDVKTVELQREVVQLRRRSACLITLLRLITTVVSDIAFSLARVRLPEGIGKWRGLPGC